MKPDQRAKLRRAEAILTRCLYAFFILILIAMLQPPHTGGEASKRAKARIEITDLQNAIQSYETMYNRLPLSNAFTNDDITLGLNPADIDGFWKVKATRFRPSNADIIMALMNFNTNANQGNQLNPQKIVFLNAKLSGDTNSSGVGRDFEYRDPWGHPYVISLDTDQNGLVRDGFYGQPILYSKGVDDASWVPTNGFYALKGRVMIWSRGPDGQASFLASAHDGVNRDNITSWW